MKLIKLIPTTAITNWLLVDEEKQIITDASNRYKEFINAKYKIEHNKYFFILKQSNYIQVSENIESIS